MEKVKSFAEKAKKAKPKKEEEPEQEFTIGRVYTAEEKQKGIDKNTQTGTPDASPKAAPPKQPPPEPNKPPRPAGVPEAPPRAAKPPPPAVPARDSKPPPPDRPPPPAGGKPPPPSTPQKSPAPVAAEKPPPPVAEKPAPPAGEKPPPPTAEKPAPPTAEKKQPPQLPAREKPSPPPRAAEPVPVTAAAPGAAAPPEPARPNSPVNARPISPANVQSTDAAEGDVRDRSGTAYTELSSIEGVPSVKARARNPNRGGAVLGHASFFEELHTEMAANLAAGGPSAPQTAPEPEPAPAAVASPPSAPRKNQGIALPGLTGHGAMPLRTASPPIEDKPPASTKPAEQPAPPLASAGNLPNPAPAPTPAPAATPAPAPAAPSPAPAATATSPATGSPNAPATVVVTVKARAIAPYTAENDAEVTFQKDDILTVLHQDSTGWWAAQLGPKTGWVPSSFLKLLPLETTVVPVAAIATPEPESASKPTDLKTEAKPTEPKPVEAKPEPAEAKPAESAVVAEPKAAETPAPVSAQPTPTSAAAPAAAPAAQVAPEKEAAAAPAAAEEKKTRVRVLPLAPAAVGLKSTTPAAAASPAAPAGAAAPAAGGGVDPAALDRQIRERKEAEVARDRAEDARRRVEEENARLKSELGSARTELLQVQEERLKLQSENQQLKESYEKDTTELGQKIQFVERERDAKLAAMTDSRKELESALDAATRRADEASIQLDQNLWNLDFANANSVKEANHAALLEQQLAAKAKRVLDLEKQVQEEKRSSETVEVENRKLKLDLDDSKEQLQSKLDEIQAMKEHSESIQKAGGETASQYEKKIERLNQKIDALIAGNQTAAGKIKEEIGKREAVEQTLEGWRAEYEEMKETHKRMEARMQQLETEAEALLQSKGQNKQSESEQASSFREAQSQLALLKAANDTLTSEVKRLTELARSKDDIIQKKHEEALHARIDERRKTIYGAPPLSLPPTAPAAEETCRALYDYEATAGDELSISVGDIIKVVSKEGQEGWWTGELNGRRGMFPDNFVELVTSTTTTSSETQATAAHTPAATAPAPEPTPAPAASNNRYRRALFPAVPDADDELGFAKEDLILVLDDTGGGWLKGEARGAVGLFPENYTKEVHPQAVAKATFSYDAQGDDELSFSEGDLIEVTNQAAEWWTGLLRGKSGLFPPNFTELLH